MVKAVGLLTCMGCILRGSKFRFFLKHSCIEKRQKYRENTSDDGELQLITAAPKINSRSQGESGSVLEPPSPH